VLVGGALGAYALLGQWGHTHGGANPYAADDPRVAYAGPFHNVHPSVAYTGDQACVPCHAEIAAKYQQHPMARALAPMAAIAATEQIEAARHNPFVADRTRFVVERQGNRVWHRTLRVGTSDQVLFTRDVEVHYAIGSAVHGRSYLTNRGGYLFQTPVSWFTQKQIWDRSPGFGNDVYSLRPVLGECLFCHANRAYPREGTTNKYDEPIISGGGIGCERCHGPGALHVQTTNRCDIVNPKQLSPALRDAVCEQCHLEGAVRVLRRGRGLYDFRPGLPLEDFISVFVYPPATGPDVHGRSKAVSQVEQMRESHCYQGGTTDKRLGCTSCHDPHTEPAAAERAAYYRRRCLECHQQQPCSEALAKRNKRNDDCAACHMPRFGTSDIAHAASTDHRVPRRPLPQAAQPAALPAAFPYWVSFHRGPVDIRNVEQGRDIAVALTKELYQSTPGLQRDAIMVIALLEEALGKDSDDVSAWEAKAQALFYLDRASEGLAAAQSLLQRMPTHERGLRMAAYGSSRAGDRAKAIAYWRQAIAVNPWSPDYHSALTLLLQQSGAWEEARSSCAVWCDLSPIDVEARMAWIANLQHEGKMAEARKEREVIEALGPENLTELRKRFGKMPHGGWTGNEK
jgi:tetratricopeptide (TPR) repeat protein